MERTRNGDAWLQIQLLDLENLKVDTKSLDADTIRSEYQRRIIKSSKLVRLARYIPYDEAMNTEQ